MSGDQKRPRETPFMGEYDITGAAVIPDDYEQIKLRRGDVSQDGVNVGGVDGVPLLVGVNKDSQ